MHDPASELRGIPLPRTSVHKGKKKGRVPLQKPRGRCGCRGSYLGSDHSGAQVPSALQVV
jgi:hypothetical protein